MNKEVEDVYNRTVSDLSITKDLDKEYLKTAFELVYCQGEIDGSREMNEKAMEMIRAIK